MTARAYVGIEIDPETRDAAVRALGETGLTLTEAIRLMVEKTARDQRLSFDAVEAMAETSRGERPNALTRQAMEEALQGKNIHKARDLDDLLWQLDN